MRLAYADLSDRLGDEVLVAPMTIPDVELALGVVSDPQFGSMVLVAGGGVFIEVLGDRQLGLVPIDAPIARRMIDKLAIAPILDGVRGRPAADKEAVATALVSLSHVADDVGDLIADIDVNPLAVGADGCVALDALVARRLSDRTRSQSPRIQSIRIQSPTRRSFGFDQPPGVQRAHLQRPRRP